MTTVMEPGFDLVCQKVDYSNDPQAKRVSMIIIVNDYQQLGYHLLQGSLNIVDNY